MEQYVDKIMEMVSLYGVKIITAIVVFIVGRWIAKGVRRLVKRAMTKAQIDPILIGFTSNIAYIGLLAFVVVAALEQLCIQTTSFIAILGAAGLAIGLALQGSLANFAAGFLMVIFRPFNVGDYIQGAGMEGTVEQIQIFTTTLVTLDHNRYHPQCQAHRRQHRQLDGQRYPARGYGLRHRLWRRHRQSPEDHRGGPGQGQPYPGRPGHSDIRG